MSRPQIIAITGGSGAIYAVRTLQVLLSAGEEVFLTLSPSGVDVIRQELGLTLSLAPNQFAAESLICCQPEWSDFKYEIPDSWTQQLHYCHYQDYFSPIASGSFLAGGMVVCPCSGSTLSAIARAAGSNLIHRAAEVQLKENRKLVLVNRETPLSVIALENMHRAAQAGATMLPAMPGWYHGVQKLDDLVNFIVGRILDQLEIDNTLIARWGGE